MVAITACTYKPSAMTVDEFHFEIHCLDVQAVQQIARKQVKR